MESVAVPDQPSRAFILTSRLVVGIITLLLLVIPWSERYSNLDSFPHDHDTELGILAIFAAFGLILCCCALLKGSSAIFWRSDTFCPSSFPGRCRSSRTATTA